MTTSQATGVTSDTLAPDIAAAGQAQHRRRQEVLDRERDQARDDRQQDEDREDRGDRRRLARQDRSDRQTERREERDRRDHPERDRRRPGRSAERRRGPSRRRAVSASGTSAATSESIAVDEIHFEVQIDARVTGFEATQASVPDSRSRAIRLPTTKIVAMTKIWAETARAGCRRASATRAGRRGSRPPAGPPRCGSMIERVGRRQHHERGRDAEDDPGPLAADPLGRVLADEGAGGRRTGRTSWEVARASRRRR